MNKERFNKLVKDYSHLDSQNKDLENLVAEFPYSQPVRMLNVKSSSSLSKKEYQQRIALAAFYTTDRNVLRSLIEKGKVPSDFVDRIIQPGKKQVKLVTKQQQAKTKVPPADPILAESKTLVSKRKQVDAEHLREEVMANLEILKQTKASFLKLAELDDDKEKDIKKTATKKTTPAKKAPIKPVAKKAVAAPTTKSKQTGKSPRAKKNELIDKFIADEPSITRGKAVKANQSDLSKTSSELKEDLVSENLAIIFAKQGKASKAIEIYKKLIWKFPQKKASFAARIEELKKK